MNLPGPPLGLFPGWPESASTAAVRVDHLTNNVGADSMADLVGYYERVFGFQVTRTLTSRAGWAPACAPRWCRAPTTG